ncbi:hypothetical protein GH733_015015 [Mirounga leonina]|nr:hypothetical protein GH733_015015 [Mirounga leonina]
MPWVFKTSWSKVPSAQIGGRNNDENEENQYERLHQTSPGFSILETCEAYEQESKQINKPRLMVSAMVIAGISNIQSGYEIPQLSQKGLKLWSSIFSQHNPYVPLGCNNLWQIGWLPRPQNQIPQGIDNWFRVHVFSFPLGPALLLNAQLGSAYRLTCYFTNWAQYQPGLGCFKPDDIDPCPCTHLIYAFAGMQNNEITTIEWNDVTVYQAFRTASLKLSWPLEAGTLELPISPLWESLGKHLFNVLVQGKCVKEAKQINKPSLMITAAVAAGISNIQSSYEIPQLAQYLDHIHIMTYDLHGSWEGYTGENSPLYKYPTDWQQHLPHLVEPNTLSLQDYVMNYWKDNGTPAEKLIVGVPTYGHTFTLSDSSNTGIGAPTSGAGPAGPYAGQAGFWAYLEICTFLKNGATQAWDAPQDVPYTYQGNEWVGYDDVKSFGLKARWLKDNNFGGAMVWAIDLDDFTGTFCNLGKFPLINTLKKALGLQCKLHRPCSARGTHNSSSQELKWGRKWEQEPSSGSSSGGSFGGSGFCAGKANGLYPVANNRNAFWHCLNGVTYQQNCQARHVFDTSCDCCNWA